MAVVCLGWWCGGGRLLFPVPEDVCLHVIASVEEPEMELALDSDGRSPLELDAESAEGGFIDECHVEEEDIRRLPGSRNRGVAAQPMKVRLRKSKAPQPMLNGWY